MHPCDNANMRVLHHPSRRNLDLTAVLHALSDPVRLLIVQRLVSEGAKPCGTFGLPVAKSTASHHFRVLRESGIIRMQPEGTQYINSLRRDDLDACFPGLLESILMAAGPL